MLRRVLPFVLAGGLFMFVACSGTNHSKLNNSPFAFAENNGGITLPEGFQAVVVAKGVVKDSIGEARHITVAEDGDIYISLRRTGGSPGIVALRDTNGDGIADRKEYFGKYTGTGIELHNGYLYYAPDTAIVRYSMEGVDLVPTSEPDVVVSGFPVQGPHASKPMTFDETGHVYVNVGAPSNTCQEEDRARRSPGLDPCPQLERHAGIWRFEADQLGQTQKEDGYRYATGIRNNGDLEWNAAIDQLFSVQHGRDQLHTLWPDLYTVEENAKLPAEEFLRVDDGDNFGWPYCYYDQIQGKRVLAPEYGGNGKIVGRCSKFEEPIMAFPGHWAPNALLFYTGNQFPDKYKHGAFIAFHGSWNRAPLPQQGYKVVFVPFENGEPIGTYETFADGFAGKDTLQSASNAEYRPMGLAQAPDGTLYILDGEKGKLWRVVYTGE